MGALPLTLAEQLDAMLLGWLERRAGRRESRPPARATAVLAIAGDAMAEIERFCAGWAMSIRRPAHGRLAVVEGPALPVEGFAHLARTLA